MSLLKEPTGTKDETRKRNADDREEDDKKVDGTVTKRFKPMMMDLEVKLEPSTRSGKVRGRPNKKLGKS